MNKLSFSFILFIITICFVKESVVVSQIVTENGTENEEVTQSSTVTVSSTTVKPKENVSCQIHNNDCKACVANSKCYYCDTDNKCNFHIQNIISDGECNINNAHFLTCKVNFKYMMIIIGSLIGVALLIITIFCCYCCCKRKGIKISKDDLKWARQKEERKLAAADRRRERAEKTDEIRKKYGLVRESNPYQKFDA